MFAYVPTIPCAVSEISRTLPTPKAHVELGGNWYPCGEDVAAGWLFNGTSFKAPVEEESDTSTPAEKAQQILVMTAQAALEKSDKTVIRAYAAGVALPTEWQNYRMALRQIVNGSDKTSKTLPVAPADYPKGS